MKAAIAVFLFVGSLVDAKCYLPDGTGATNPIWRECSTDLSDPLSNICCALNRTNPAGGLRSEGETAETCLPNGLCEQSSVSDSGNITTSYRRAYCTSQEWESGKCLTTCGKAVRSPHSLNRLHCSHLRFDRLSPSSSPIPSLHWLGRFSWQLHHVLLFRQFAHRRSRTVRMRRTHRTCVAAALRLYLVHGGLLQEIRLLLIHAVATIQLRRMAPVRQISSRLLLSLRRQRQPGADCEESGSTNNGTDGDADFGTRRHALGFFRVALRGGC